MVSFGGLAENQSGIFLSRKRLFAVARKWLARGVRVYTKYRFAPKPKRKARPKRTAVFVTLVLFAGIAWLAVERRWIGTSRDNVGTAKTSVAAGPDTSTIPAPTNLTTQKTQGTSNGINAEIVRPPMETVAVLTAQIALDCLGISPGSIDGVLGSQTRAAIRAFQLREDLPQTGQLDEKTSTALALTSPPLVSYQIGPNDLSRLCPLANSWYGKSRQERLDYETLIEYVAERSHSHPDLIRRLNSGMEWTVATPGSRIVVPAVERQPPRSRAALLQIRLGERALRAFDSTNRLLAHFPCSIAQRVEKRPVGELRVTVVVPNPDYMFNPDIFPESAEAQELAGRKLHIKPGPNNPVGTAWIGLNLSGYGIHGTPRPEDVGRTESHGCFRLANWNAEYLLQLVTVGTPVRIEP
jgi:lipoprotein-anchoring transpeptidase ErfK/SrfK